MTQHPSGKPSQTAQAHHSSTPQPIGPQKPPTGRRRLDPKYVILPLIVFLLIAIVIYFATHSVVAITIEGIVIGLFGGLLSIRQFRELAEETLDHLIGLINGLLAIRPTKSWVPWLVTAFSLLVTLILLLVMVIPRFAPEPKPEPKPEVSCSLLPCIVPTSDNQYIGISDGSDGFLHWNNGPSLDPVTYTTEQLIKNENPKIAGQSPQVVLIVLTTLTPGGTDSGFGTDDLQGIYTLQKEVNDECVKKCLKIQVLLANAGTDMKHADIVVKQIESLPQTEQVLGIVGWPVSTSYAIEAIQQLSQASQPILMMSATESSDALTGISPYYFRVAPADSEQGFIDADLVTQNFSDVKTAVVFYTEDPTHPYGRTLSSAFIERFSQKSDHRVIMEPYSAEVSQSQQNKDIRSDIDSLSNKITPGTPYIVYFAGYSNAFNSLLSDLHQAPMPDLKGVISGNAAYDLRGYGGSGNYKNIYFTAFAFPDEWDTPPQGDSNPCDIPPLDGDSYGRIFFCEYATNFNPQGQQHPSPYGYTRADSTVILAYDSASVLVHAYVQIQSTKASAMRAMLLNDGRHAFEGVSGQIVFGSDGNPLNKPMVWLQVDVHGKTGLVKFVQGQPQAPRTTLPTYDWG